MVLLAGVKLCASGRIVQWLTPATATVQIPRLVHLMTALSTMFVGAVGLVDNLRRRMTKGLRMLYVWPR